MRRLWFGLAVLVVLGVVLTARWMESLITSKDVQQTLTERLSEMSGFTVGLSSPLEFSWLPLPGLVVQGLSLTNEKIDPKSPLVEVGSLRLRVSLFESLIHWQWTLQELVVDDVQVSLLRNRSGLSNWQTDSKAAPAKPSEEGGDFDANAMVGRVRELLVRDLTLHYRDEVSGSAFELDSVRMDLVRPGDDEAGKVLFEGRFDEDVLRLTGHFRMDAPSPDRATETGLEVDLKADYAGEVLKVGAKGFLGQIPDLSALSVDFTVSSDSPGGLAKKFAEPHWEKPAREIREVSFSGHFAGKGADGLSVTKGDLRLGMGDALDLSVSGSLMDVLTGEGLNADVGLKSTSPSTLLESLEIAAPPIKTVSGEAEVKGSLSEPTIEGLKVRADLESGVVLTAAGSYRGGTKSPRSTVALTLKADALENLVRSLESIPGETGNRVNKALSDTPQKEAVTHLLGMGPVDVSADLAWSGGPWALKSIQGKVGTDSGEWLRLSGRGESLWPEPSGLQVRVDSRIENPPLGLPGREALLDHLDSVRLGLTWNMEDASSASLDDLEIHVDVAGDLSLSVTGQVELKGDTLHGAKGTVSVKADSLAEFDGLAGRSLPPWSPFSLDARFHGTAQKWTLGNIVLGLGRASLTGEASWEKENTIPRFGLRLDVDRLSLPRASRAFREEPKSKPAQAPPDESSSADSSVASSVDWSWLSSTEADVVLSAGQVVLGDGWVGEDMLFEVEWGGGLLKGPRFDMKWPNGGAQVRARVDARKERADLELGVAAHGLDVKAIVGWLGQPRAISGGAEVVLDLSTHGSTRKDLIAGLDGKALLHVSHGTVLDRYANALQLGFEGVGSGSSDEQPMNCLIAALDSKQGVVTTQALLWDTPVKLVRGLGVLDMNTDHLDLLLRPHLKRTIARSVTAAIRIEGPLEDLRIRPEPLQTVSDLARGLLGRTLRVVDRVTPQVGQAVIGLGARTGSMMASTGLNIPSVMDFLASPETCESILASKEVKQMEAFQPAQKMAY